MSDRRKTPSFEYPPVIEVALGVQFDTPLPLRFVDYGPIWDLYRDRYPEYQEHPPLAPVLEAFGDEAPHDPLDMLNAAVLPRAAVRLWFANASTGGLIQLQQDRFVFNWRRPPTDQAYPRFSWVLAQFEAEYRALLAFLAEQGIEPPRPNLCDVTYVNHIMAGEGWADHAELHAVFPSLQLPMVSTQRAVAEEADVRIRFSMVGHDGQPGRLHMRAFPAVRRNDEAKLFVVNLIARRRPSGPDAAGVVAAIRDGHDWVVQTFKDVTSAEMHRIWGLQDA